MKNVCCSLVALWAKASRFGAVHPGRVILIGGGLYGLGCALVCMSVRARRNALIEEFLL